MTSLSHSRRKHFSFSTMEELPVDLLTRVLEFSELPERLQLARCSAGLLKLITKECTTLWIKIDFCRDRSFHKKADALTDTMLTALLARVNARDVTKCLSLRFCSKIRGDGLVPLRSSSVLECTDLRTASNTLDMSLTTDILRTMIPHKLFEVKFSSTSLSEERSYASTVATRQRFFRDLRAEKHRQAIQQRVVCSSCQYPVAEEGRQFVPRINGLPCSHCQECLEHFCRKSSCLVAMNDCKMCERTSCNECALVKRCDDCYESYCGDCAFIDACSFCKQTYCEMCCMVSTCRDCSKCVCDHCSENQQDPTLVFCDSCWHCYCVNCRTVSTCYGCSADLCSRCYDMFDCGRCGKSFCDECSAFCLGCEEILCPECSDTKVCDTCYSSFCEGCRGARCKGCNELLCHRCTARHDISIVRCNGCSDSFCNECCEVPCCDCCEESYCTQCMSKCKKCNGTFCDGCSGNCDSCKMNTCNTCTKQGDSTVSSLPLCCTVCGQYSNDTSFCGACKESRVSKSLVIPSVYQGVCSTCAEENPAKRMKRM